MTVPDLRQAFFDGFNTILIGGLAALIGCAGWGALCFAVATATRLLSGSAASGTVVSAWMFQAGLLIIVPVAIGLGARSAIRR